MEIMSIEEIRDGLADRTLTIVQQKTGLAYGTLQRLQRGEDRRYSIGVLKVISDYLRGN